MSRKFYCLFLLIAVSLFVFNFKLVYANSYPGKDGKTNSQSKITGEYASNEIIVKFKKGCTDATRMQMVKTFGALSSRNSYGNHFNVITIKENEVQKMVKLFSSSPHVEYAEPNYVRRAYFTPNDEFFEKQWHMDQINCQKAWDISTGKGVTVAVIDTGVNPNGFDGFGNRLIQGRDFAQKDKDSTDQNGHGTHVAGTIAQATNNGTGVVGVAFDANILAVRVLNRYGFGNASNVVDGMRWAADNGAHIINLSLGGAESSLAEIAAINDIHAQGVVIIAAAGNASGPVSSPAILENVIAVGSVRFDKTLSFFSNFGPEIDVVAPGGDMSVDQNGDGLGDGVFQETFTAGGLLKRDIKFGYFGLIGTSQASPHVAGVAALLLAKDPLLTPDEVRDILRSTATDLGCPGRDNTYGYGLVNAYGALDPSTVSVPEELLPDKEPSTEFKNSGFEEGGCPFSGWTAGDNELSPLTPWSVCAANSCGFFGNNSPVEGVLDALNGFDGSAGYEAFLYQDVVVPDENARVTFQDRIQYDGFNISSLLPRVYEVQVRDLDNNVLEVLHHQEVLLNGQLYTDLGWQKRDFDISAFAGKTVKIYIQLFVPETNTGPALIEFDDFKLEGDSLTITN